MSSWSSSPADGGAPGGPACTADDGAEALTLDVSFKVAGRLVVPVHPALLRITEGAGAGSVVGRHAIPLGADGSGHPRTTVMETVVAASDRPGFPAARRSAPLPRPLVRATAGRLCRDVPAYAERRQQLRSTGRFPGWAG
ncbi:DUF5914 domain-containing protein [Streptomyces violaceusniger]|uniref:DUF5914 domain-containing protein n=1 Tax=Streptomyces violaceusniger TaxID=68280 RepID=UPI0002DAD09D